MNDMGTGGIGGYQPTGTFWDSTKNWLFGKEKAGSPGEYTQGNWGNVGQLGLGMFDAWMGYKQYQLAQDSLSHQKDVFATNLQNQSQLINNQLGTDYERRKAQAAQVGQDTSNWASTDDWLKTNGATKEIVSS